RDKAIKTFPISLQGDLSSGIIFHSWGHIFIDRTSVSPVIIRIISLITWTRGGMIYGNRSGSGVFIIGGKSITSTRAFTLAYTTTEITVMSTTKITIIMSS